ncbi:MAG: serine/threonine-protein kinase [Pyrinomonadaceae bacterium]|nr:serine/threonine-protein kinase [Pyrinomonadaceae bacterium]
MQTEDWEKVKELLDEVLQIEPSERQHFLEKSDFSKQVRDEVQSLLAFEDQADDLMNLSALELSKDFFTDLIAEEDSNALIGTQIGVYQIIRELGYGGMGAVYLAERNDGKFEQKVALKLLKREMNTAALRRRFQQEQHILASLEHPNIARLLNAGTTDDKIPYLAMEYVEGVPIDDYCNKHQLDLGQRLDLFRQVCAAVNFAHRNLIVHRDLKPSNILVNSEGIPKLLDFGISKILSGDFGQDEKATVTRMGAMTLGYASPEQLQSKSVTTSTDIYSLGVILYELLSGHRPFEEEEYDFKEIYKVVLEKDPIPPSALIEAISKRIKSKTESETELKPDREGELEKKPTKLLADTGENKIRYTLPNTISLTSNSLRGDLDNIVLKALRKEPERRYLSAENFAEDIHRHQRGLPVTARPNTFSYRAEKFIKRNRATVVAGVLILLAIISGIIATLWQSRIAQIERSKAEKRFGDVRKLANSFLFEFSPQIENLPGSMPARQLLVTRALEYLDSLSQESATDLELQNELAKAYEKVGDVQGNPDTPNIGDLKGALESYEKAQSIRRQLMQNKSDVEMDADLANNLEVTANINMNGGEFDKAASSLAEAVSLREKVTAQKPKDPAALASLAKALRLSGFIPFYDSKPEESTLFYNRSIQILAPLAEEFPDDPIIGLLCANLYIDIGENFSYLEQPKLAAENIQKGLEMFEVLNDKHPNNNRIRRSFFIAHLKRGELYRDSDDLPNSLKLYDKAVEIAEESIRLNPGSFQARRDLVIALKQRAVTLKAVNRFKDSINDFSEAIKISEQLKKEDPNNILIAYDIGGSYHDLSELYFLMRDFPAVINSAEKTQEYCQEVLVKNPDHTQAKNVIARSKLYAGKAFAATPNLPESRQKAMENFLASREICNNLKASGKFRPQDEKRFAELETEISKLQGKK